MAVLTYLTGQVWVQLNHTALLHVAGTIQTLLALLPVGLGTIGSAYSDIVRFKFRFRFRVSGLNSWLDLALSSLSSYKLGIRASLRSLAKLALC
jgi:hypothetical protein